MKRLSIVLLVAACSHTPSKPAETTTPTTPAAADPVAAQIEEGKGLYVANCAKCHGDAGQGTKEAPAVVGKDAFPLKAPDGRKRDAEFHTAADVFAWTTKNMPPKNPG